MVHQHEFELETAGHRDMHDLTECVAAIVRDAGIATGFVHVFNFGSTGAIPNCWVGGFG